MSTAFVRLVGALAPAAAFAALGCGVATDSVVVSAASSLRPAIEEIAAEYAASGGAPVVVNAASSSTLARQIAQGAPADLFVSADARQMDVVEQSGRVASGTRVNLLSNRLAVVAPSAGATSLERLEDLAGDDIRRIGVGEPTAVPAGVYARELLANHGLWKRLEPKLVPGGSVEMVLAAAESGNVDAAIVYLTDARRSSRVRTLLVVEVGEMTPRVVYPAAVLTGGQNEAGARRFLAYLQGEGRAVFTAHGFGEPGKP